MTSYTPEQKIKIKHLLSLNDDIDRIPSVSAGGVYSVSNYLESHDLTETKCCIWKNWYAVCSSFPDSDGDWTLRAFYSPRAGGWYIAGHEIYADDDLKISNEKHDQWLTYTDLQKSILTTWLIEERKKIKETKEISIPMLNRELLENIKNEKPLPIVERAYRLLFFIASSYDVGEPIPISLSNNIIIRDEINFPQGFFSAHSESKNINELNGMLDYLANNNFIELTQGSKHNFAGQVAVLSLDGKAETEKTINKDSDEVFIAMWFDDSMNNVSAAIQEGIKQAGYKPVRIDKTKHNNKIDDEIIAAIKRARFVVADFTDGDKGERGGVYYEAGFAHGLGIKVVFTCREDILKKIHFDTRQYVHIIWTENKLNDFTKQISNHISATVGDGPYKDKK